MSFDSTFSAFLALLVFIGVLYWLKVPAMIAGMLDKQSAAIRKELDDARALREQAEALRVEHEQKLRMAESLARDIVRSAKEQAEALAAETREQLEAEIKRRTAQAEESIARAEAAATAEVRNAAVDAAIEAARASLRADLRGDAAGRVFNDGLAELGAKFR